MSKRGDLMDKVSVIIRNKNEGAYIGFAIQSCLDYFNKPEIIIVDNGSTDDSLEIVNLFKDRTSISVISIDDYTPGKSINKGVKVATHPTILVLSAHAQITAVDLEDVNKQLQNYVAVFGQQNPVYRGKKISKRYVWSHFKDEDQVNLFSSIEKRPFLHNAFCFYKKSTLLQHPMPEQYPGKEDRFWARDMINHGNDYLYSPIHKANHFYTERGATWKGIG